MDFVKKIDFKDPLTISSILIGILGIGMIAYSFIHRQTTAMLPTPSASTTQGIPAPVETVGPEDVIAQLKKKETEYNEYQMRKRVIELARTIAPEKSSKPIDTKPESDNTFTVQVNSFQDPTQANQFVEHLRQKGYPAFKVSKVIAGKEWYRIRMGSFVNKTDADKFVKEIHTRENLTPFVIRNAE